jgi:hypothetical protein
MTAEQLTAIIGNYEDHVYDKGGKNDWHYVIVSKASGGTTLKWANRAGKIWTLTATADPTKLSVGSDCPYFIMDNSGGPHQTYKEATVVWDGGKVTGLIGPYNNLYTRTTDFTDTKYGLETLDLSGPVVLNSEHLQMTGLSGASFEASIGGESCWQIKLGFGYIDFTYNMDKQRDITLSLDLHSRKRSDLKIMGPVPGQRNERGEPLIPWPDALLGTLAYLRDDGKIKITWNDHVVAEHFEPHIDGFYHKSWFVEAGWTIAGVNKIRVELEGELTKGVGPVLLSKLSVSNFKMQDQQQSMWCWDAIGVSVADYALRYRNHWVQCEMYNAVKGTKDACNYGYRILAKDDPPLHPVPCNQGGWPRHSLGKAEVLGALSGVPAAWDGIVGQLAVACPVVCVVWWRTGGGHVVAITGAYSTGDGAAKVNFVVIDDPWDGHSTMTYDTFKSDYQHLGDWKETLFTTLGPTAKTP